MKIAVSSMGKELTSAVDPRFGRCSYFITYNTDSESIKSTENKGQVSGGGAGIAAAQQVMDEGIGAVITGSLGPNAFNLFKSADIKVYKCGAVKVKEAIELLKEGKLEELTEADPSHPGFGAENGKVFRGGR